MVVSGDVKILVYMYLQSYERVRTASTLNAEDGRESTMISDVNKKTRSKMRSMLYLSVRGLRRKYRVEAYANLSEMF